MSLKEYSDAASKGNQEKAVHKQRRRSKNFLKLFIALTTLMSVVRGENQSLMQFFGINLLVGASIASNYFHLHIYQYQKVLFCAKNSEHTIYVGSHSYLKKQYTGKHLSL